MFAKLTGSPGNNRLATRKRVQVFPDLGYDTMNVSSGRTASVRPAMSRPNVYFNTRLIP